MRLELATPQDDNELKTFFNQEIVNGLYDHRVVRTHSFFDQYKLTTNDYLTYFLRDNNKQIKAMASILFKKAYVNDQEQTIGYVTDLRLSASRKATTLWAKEIVQSLEQAKLERQCQYVFSELELYDSNTYNMLLHRRNRNTRLPRYHLFRKFFAIVIYGKKMMAELPLDTIKINYGRLEDAEAVSLYLQTKSVRRPLRYHLSTEELLRRCQSWPGFSIENFLIARNYRGDIIGCMAPWDNSGVQKIVAQRYHGKSFQVYSTSRILSQLALSRPLPQEGQAFNVKHITHSAYDNPDIFYALLCKAYDDCQNRELLVYPNYFGEYSTRPPLSFLEIKIPYGFYNVLDHEMKLPSFLYPNSFQPAPDFQFSFF